ncbi:hypothetical protein GIB67_012260 [Kingdonia uniflora]|uniref:DNA-directed RNA polymerase III subunit RPC6 n=1 Tax=Kingdonia uniflora TaxID=39325 RepID=A0A7J7LAW4_9MAGN|nr:hypothetical protein GIB67_012260 [Kingdonia uniflora]
MPRPPRRKLLASSDGITDPDRALLELVCSKKELGESQLHDHVVTKSVKTLLAKKVIKEVINIHNKRGKCYMAVEFQPSVELTGGVFYTDGKLDAGVDGTRVLNFEITLKRVQDIVGTLILDKDVEELKSCGTGYFADIPKGKTCYQCLDSAGVEKVGSERHALGHSLSVDIRVSFTKRREEGYYLPLRSSAVRILKKSGVLPTFPGIIAFGLILTFFERMPRAPAKRVDSKTSSDGLTDPDRALLELVRSKKDMGIMRFDMRRESQLQDHVITKSVKTLLAKKVIKEVINIHNKRGKCYMAVEFQPSVELTGGAFYNDGKLDAELINHLKKLCLKIITKMKVATLENIVGSVNKYGLVKFEITLKQIQEIVGTLILDKDVEELKSSETGDFADIPRGKTCYKCLNSAGVEKVGALGSIPCGVCPRISDCTPDGVISPKTCVYYTKWLDFNF